MFSKYGWRSRIVVFVFSLNSAYRRQIASVIQSGYLVHDYNGTSPDGTYDCIAWPNSGACRQCVAKVTDDGNVAECFKCPPGMELKKGPPDETEKGFVNFEFTWKNHCASKNHEEHRVIIIRHGQSAWNKFMEDYHKLPVVIGGFYGWDSPLSRLGLRQAQRLAQILKKAGEQVYGRTQPSDAVLERDDIVKLSSARSELSKVNLEDVIKIVHKASGETFSDEVLVNSLAKNENREALDVLLGRKCEHTNFVSSQLARAMDTLLIGTLESRLTCEWDWKISSNLQEIEHNANCTPNAQQPFQHPVQTDEQGNAYIANDMRNTKDYVELRYADSDVSRLTKPHGWIKRARVFDQSAQMLDELNWMFSEKKSFTVWAGHSIWFRHFFIRFADLGNPDCKKLTEIKMANTAVVSFKVLKEEDNNSQVTYVVTECKFIHLGSSEDYEFKLEKDDSDALIPEPSDFNFGVSSIMGWKCCCSMTSDEESDGGKKENNQTKEKERKKSRCVLAKTSKCKYPNKWSDIWPKKDMSYKIKAVRYRWSHNRGPCDVNVGDIPFFTRPLPPDPRSPTTA